MSKKTSKIFFLLIAIFIIAALVTSCGDTASKRKKHYDKGIAFVKEGNYRGAIIEFKNAIEKDPNFFEARYQLGIAYLETGYIDSAEKELKKALKLQPSLVDAHLYLGKVYLLKGYQDKKELDNSISELRTYLDKKIGDPGALEVLGAVHMAKRDFENAHSFLNQAINNAPDRTSAYITLARLYLEEQKPAKAREVINNVISKNGKDIKALQTLCDLEKREERYEAAIKCYKNIIEIAPDQELAANTEIGILHVMTKKYDEAIKTAEYIISKNPKKAEGYYIKGLSFYGKNRLNDAITNLQIAIKFNPAMIGAHYFSGLAHYLNGELEQARNELYKVAAARPDMLDVYLVIGLINLKKGWTEEAIKEINKVIEKSPDNAFAHNLLGTAYMVKKEYDVALKEMEKTQELDPKLVDTYMKRGKYYIMMGESTAAEREFRTALNTNPDRNEIRTTLVLFLIRGKRYDSAIQVCKEGLKNNLADAFLYNLLGLGYLGKKEISSAVSNFDRAKSLNPKFIAPYMNLASLYVSEWKDDKALEEYNAALKADPGNVEVLVACASLLERVGKEAEAFDRYAKAKYTGTPVGYMALAAFYVRKNDYKHGIDTLKELLTRTPKLIEARDELAAIYLKKNNIKEAEAKYKEIIDLTPDSPFGHNRLAALYIKTGDNEKAISELDASLKIKPYQPEIIGALADIYIKKKDFRSAEGIAQQVIITHPKMGFGYHLMADVLSRQKTYEKALFYYEKAEKIGRNNFLSPIAAGNIYFFQGKTTKALDAYKRAEKVNPYYAPVYFYQGMIFERMGEKNRAMERYKKTISLNPKYVPALNNLAYLYAEKRQMLQEAFKLAETAKNLAPKNGAITDTLGWVNYQKGDYDKAIILFKEAISLLANEPSVRYHLGLAYIKKGMKTEARKELEGALRLASNFPEAGEAKRILKELQKNNQ